MAVAILSYVRLSQSTAANLSSPEGERLDWPTRCATNLNGSLDLTTVREWNRALKAFGHHGAPKLDFLFFGVTVYRSNRRRNTRSSTASLSALVGFSRRAMADLFENRQTSGAWMMARMLAVVGVPAVALIVMTGLMLSTAVGTQRSGRAAIVELERFLAVDNLVTNLQAGHTERILVGWYSRKAHQLVGQCETLRHSNPRAAGL